MVPGAKPVPVAVHDTLLIVIVLLPLVKGPAAWWVNVTVEATPVLTFTKTLTAPSVFAMSGTESGLAFAKLIADIPIVREAVAATAAFIVRVFVSVAADAFS
jgi:hypothetical protein